MELRSSAIIDSEIEGHYAFLPFADQIATREHRHDFYEIFLIVEGSIYHHVNGEVLLLSSGNLVFIRPDDGHYYRRNADQNCGLINLAFLSSTFSALSDYLGLVAHDELLLTMALPPTVLLTATEKNHLVAQLKAWGRLTYRDKVRSRLALRALLAEIMSNYFIARAEDYGGDVPQWLVELCQQMQQKAYVVEGREALLRLASRAPEYVGRVFKTHLGVTPSQFVNNLRLDYAGDLLLHTDMPATEVCFAVGFENLSHFYHLFKARWQCSPLQFRKLNRRTLIP